MQSVVVWILLMSGGSAGSPMQTIGHFENEADCRLTLGAVNKATSDLSGISTMRGVCVQAKLIKP